MRCPSKTEEFGVVDHLNSEFEDILLRETLLRGKWMIDSCFVCTAIIY